MRCCTSARARRAPPGRARSSARQGRARPVDGRAPSQRRACAACRPTRWDAVGGLRQPETLQQLVHPRSSPSRKPYTRAWRARFSRPVAVRSTAERCPTQPIDRRTRSGCRMTSSPPTVAARSQASRVVRIFTVVDLPAPFGPSSAKIDPGSTANVRPSSAVTSFGYVFLKGRQPQSHTASASLSARYGFLQSPSILATKIFTCQETSIDRRERLHLEQLGTMKSAPTSAPPRSSTKGRG